MFLPEDTTYNDIRKKSLDEWLNDMENHEDLAVNGGVALVRGYIKHLEDEINKLEEENRLKNDYMKKVVAKLKSI